MANTLTVQRKKGIMTHEQRRKLIETPITFNIYGPLKSAGTSTVDEEGLERRFTPTPVGTGMYRIYPSKVNAHE